MSFKGTGSGEGLQRYKHCSFNPVPLPRFLKGRDFLTTVDPKAAFAIDNVCDWCVFLKESVTPSDVISATSVNG